MTTKKTPADGSPSKAKERIAVEAKRPRKPRAKREPRPSPLAMKAIALMQEGLAKNITECAKALHCSRANLSRQLNTPAAKHHIVGSARLELVNAVSYAARQKLRLLDARSEKVRSEVSSEVMAIGGNIVAPRPALVSVAIDQREQHGYVINLTGHPEGEAIARVERGEFAIRNNSIVDLAPSPVVEDVPIAVQIDVEDGPKSPSHWHQPAGRQV